MQFLSTGDILGSYGRGGNSSVNPITVVTTSDNPPILGRRLSVPTPAALKQSGMPPLPPHLVSSTHSTPNGATKSTLNSNTPNGYVTSSVVPPTGASNPSSGPPSYRHYRGAPPNGPSSYTNHQAPNTRGQSNSTAASSGPIIGGVPVGNLIPPPPPPTASQGTAGPAFGKRFYNKKFFPSS